MSADEHVRELTASINELQVQMTNHNRNQGGEGQGARQMGPINQRVLANRRRNQHQHQHQNYQVPRGSSGNPSHFAFMNLNSSNSQSPFHLNNNSSYRATDDMTTMLRQRIQTNRNNANNSGAASSLERHGQRQRHLANNMFMNLNMENDIEMMGMHPQHQPGFFSMAGLDDINPVLPPAQHQILRQNENFIGSRRNNTAHRQQRMRQNEQRPTNSNHSQPRSPLARRSNLPTEWNQAAQSGLNQQ